jgi:acetolactate synthase-1/2/3 large subunit
VKYAEAYGAYGHRPQTATELGTTLRRCLGSPGVHLIDMAIDYSDNARVLGEELATLTAAL